MFGPFPSAMGFARVRSISMRPWVRRIVLGALGQLRCAMLVVWCVGQFPYVLGVLKGSSGSFGCFRHISLRSWGRGVCRSIPVRYRGGLVRLSAFTPFPYSLGVVRVRSVNRGGLCGRSGSFGQFLCSLGCVGFVRVLLVHSSAT